MVRPCKNPVCLAEIPDLQETLEVIEQARERCVPVSPTVELHAFGFCSEACEHAYTNREQIRSLRREIRAKGKPS